MTNLELKLEGRSYNIYIGNGLIGNANRLFNLDRRVFIVTDSGVPKEYSQAVAGICESAVTVTVNEGEGSKSIATLERLLTEMAKFEMGRTDCVVAVGGGVVGDLAGFAASVYMRGIDFYNVPTTLLSQLDSSIGGKTAINLGGIKNVVGAFHQPRGVIIDTDVLKTLPKRQISAGLAEGIKMALTSDKELFEYIESLDKLDNDAMEKIIVASLKIKKAVVEEDERECGNRRILNFGHTLGHGIEAFGGLYHGECVALGMIPMCEESVRERLLGVLSKFDLPTKPECDIDSALALVLHDKKRTENGVVAVLVDSVGGCKLEKMSFQDFGELVKKTF